MIQEDVAMGFTVWFLVLYVVGLIGVFGYVVRALRQGRELLYDSHASTHA
jgi:hypothetical protein